MNFHLEKDHHQDTKTPRKDLSIEEERVAALIVDAAIKVHRTLGPGLLESVYEACLLKAFEKFLPVHDAQVLTYLKLSSRRLGFLLNFNVPVMKNGISRFVL